MKINLLIFLLLVLFVFEGNSQRLPDLWLKAESVSEGDNVWRDITNNNLFIENSSLFERGALINYNPTISFENVVDNLSILLDDSDLEHITAFIVFRNGVSEEENPIWGTTNTQSHKILVSNMNIYDEFNRFEYSYGQIVEPLLVSISKYWDKVNEDENVGLFFGGNNEMFDSKFDGDIAEFMLFKEPLSKTDYDIINSYLSLKYGIEILQTNYLNPYGDIILNSDENSDYFAKIFGLGRNSSYNLHQKQSHSIDNAVSIAIGDFYNDNSLNNNILPKDSYLFVSNDGAEYGEGVSLYNSQSSSLLLNSSKWRISSYGTYINDENLILKVNSDSIFKDNDVDLLMVIDLSEDGSYKNYMKIEPTYKESNGNIFFKNINWNGNYIDNRYFTFAKFEDINVNLSYIKPQCDKELPHILGVIESDNTPYRLQIYNSENTTVLDSILESNEFDIELLTLDKYLVEISDAKENRVKYSTGKNIASYSAKRFLETDYWIYDAPLKLLLSEILDNTISSFYIYYEDEILSINDDVILNNAGEYSLIYYTENGCEIQEEFYVFDKRDGEKTAVDNLLSDRASVILYPNPLFNTEYCIDIELEQVCEIQIELYTMDGVKIESHKLSHSNKSRFDGVVSKSGVYVVIVKSEGEIIYKSKLIKL